MLYAAAGMLLPLFFRLSDRTQLWVAAALILLPVGLDALTEWGGVDFSEPFYNAWWATAGRYGINEDNFASWLCDAHSYPQMFAFLLQGACERMWESHVIALCMECHSWACVGRHRAFVAICRQCHTDGSGLYYCLLPVVQAISRT